MFHERRLRPCVCVCSESRARVKDGAAGEYDVGGEEGEVLVDAGLHDIGRAQSYRRPISPCRFFWFECCAQKPNRVLSLHIRYCLGSKGIEVLLVQEM